VVLYLLAGLASRRSHLVADAAGGEDRAARVLWGVNLGVFAIMLAAGWLDVLPALIGAFVILHVVHNLWRPILISRFDIHGDESQGASLLSVESQAQRLATMVLAPLLGLAVDGAGAAAAGGQFWPVGGVGFVVALVFFAGALVATRVPEARS
jgi:hypothetical protein